MAFGGFEEGGNSQPMAEINTTPLVDVMLVLLVIFIITAPLFQQAVAIDVPQVDAPGLTQDPEVIRLSLDAAGKLFLDDAPVTPESLVVTLQQSASRNPELHLRADRDTRYARLAEIIAMAQRAGIVRIAFVTEPTRQ